MRLEYIGRMEVPGFSGDLRLWNVLDPSNPYHKSSRTLEGLQELGIVPRKGIIVYSTHSFTYTR